MRTLLTTLHAKYIHNSLALPCLAAYCGNDCGELVIREYTVHEPKENVLGAILAEEPDVVCFSVYLWNRRETCELIDLLATVDPALRIVVGGPEVSFDGADLFARHPGLSALVRGEGEMPLRGLLAAWRNGRAPDGVPRLAWRRDGEIVEGPDAPPLAALDAIPSPFRAGLVDTTRGFVYYETSRGCPYRCSFCMSALDDTVRSFSMERILSDLAWLIDRDVAMIKLVDRTFNYDPGRALEIFRFILANNRSSHFHFEIGAHLLNDETIRLLEEVPEGMFHFEIGVQSTLPETLTAIDRRVSLEQVFASIRALKKRTRVALHLDLIAGLPGEGYRHFLGAIDTLLALQPDHLQIEPVKLLPGSPLRAAAKTQNLRHAPNPPYTVVSSDSLSFVELEQLRAISRLLDLSFNSGRLKGLLGALAEREGSVSAGLEMLALHLQKKGQFRLPLSQAGLFEAVWSFVKERFRGAELALLREHLARDFALCERVVPANAPEFFDTALCDAEQGRVREAVQRRQLELRGENTRLQYFAAAFRRLDATGARSIRLFLYLTRGGAGRTVEELIFPGDADAAKQL